MSDRVIPDSREAHAVIEQLIDAIQAVPFVHVCYCGAALADHKFYDDKIYDVQGRTCPGALGGEFRTDIAQTKTAHRQAQIDVVAALLADVLGSPTSQDQKNQEDTRVDERTDSPLPVTTAGANEAIPSTASDTQVSNERARICDRIKKAVLESTPDTADPFESPESDEYWRGFNMCSAVYTRALIAVRESLICPTCGAPAHRGDAKAKLDALLPAWVEPALTASAEVVSPVPQFDPATPVEVQMGEVVAVTPETIRDVLTKRFGGGSPGSGLVMTCHEAHALMAFFQKDRR